MTKEGFEKIWERAQERSRAVLVVKGAEYASEGDRFYNFKRAALLEVQGTSPEAALWNMNVKQLVSVIDIIEALEDGKLPTQAQIDEKLGDVDNYFHLLEGLLTERISPIDL